MREPVMPDTTNRQPCSRFFLVLFQSGLFRDRLGTIGYPVLHQVQQCLDGVVNTAAETTEIDVWLESMGGDAHTAFRIFLDLRSRCRKMRVVIPDSAKSAATLLALGMDEIYMAPSAELGPLDAQMEHPDREGVTVSALDVSKALGFLGDFALDYIVKGGNSVLQSTGLPRANVLAEFSAFAAKFLEPVMTKFDPHLIHRAAKQLAVAHHYAMQMLNLRRLSDDDKARKCNTNELVKRLVENYPAHECVISREEARDLPLPIKDSECYDRWSQVRDCYRAYQEGTLTIEDSRSYIRVLTDTELNEPADGSPEEKTNGTADQDQTNLHQGTAGRVKRPRKCSKVPIDTAEIARRIAISPVSEAPRPRWGRQDKR
jgi:hypothetical protein